MRRKTIAEPGPRMADLSKAPTGIQGLDEITEGGLPMHRSTLLRGGPGSGKTLLATEFLVRGALQYGEPGVLMTFEETGEDLALNMASLGFPVAKLIGEKKLVVDFVRIDRSDILETGDYSLDGLFVRLGHAIDTIGARRVVLDSLEVLFANLSDLAVLRSELRRLFLWLKGKAVTSIITCERGEGALGKDFIEEYVSDCVMVLDHRVDRQFTTRRLRIVKYRGSRHGLDEYPFLIGARGLSVLPITSMGLAHAVSTERVLSGIPRLDIMLGGKGYYRGSCILVSGTSGTGKSTISVHLAHETCKQGQRCLMFLFEESPDQVVRNMRSIGIDLQPWIDQGLLRIHASRPTLCGLETHLVTMHTVIEEFMPSVVVIDPVTNFESAGTMAEANSLLSRLIDFLKTRQITALLTSLSTQAVGDADSGAGISSVVDTWLVVRNLESGGERNRLLYVLKSRGMEHSNQVREFRLSSQGIELIDVYVGPGGVLAGTARLTQEAREIADANAYREESERRKDELDRSLVALQMELQIAEKARKRLNIQITSRNRLLQQDRGAMASARSADGVFGRKPGPGEGA
jgi:circadian clock protein KaiC